MRLTLALAALGLATRYVAGQQQQQQQWQDFGAMPDFVKQPFYDAVARSPSLAKRDGSCAENSHPCEQQCPSLSQPSAVHEAMDPPRSISRRMSHANQATGTHKAPTSTQPNVAKTPNTAS